MAATKTRSFGSPSPTPPPMHDQGANGVAYAGGGRCSRREAASKNTSCASSRESPVRAIESCQAWEETIPVTLSRVPADQMNAPLSDLGGKGRQSDTICAPATQQLPASIWRRPDASAGGVVRPGDAWRTPTAGSGRPATRDQSDFLALHVSWAARRHLVATLDARPTTRRSTRSFVLTGEPAARLKPR